MPKDIRFIILAQIFLLKVAVPGYQHDDFRGKAEIHIRWFLDSPFRGKDEGNELGEKGIAVEQESVLSAGQNPIVEDVHVVRGAVFGKHG